MKKCGRKQKLSPEDAERARELRAKALEAQRDGSFAAIGRLFNCSPNTVRAYCVGSHKRDVANPSPGY